MDPDKKTLVGLIDRQADCGCGCSNNNKPCNPLNKTSKSREPLRLGIINFNLGIGSSEIVLGGGPTPQAPYCYPNQSEISATCTNSNHVNDGNCALTGAGQNLECSNFTGAWCWTVGGNCQAVTLTLTYDPNPLD